MVYPFIMELLAPLRRSFIPHRALGLFFHLSLPAPLYGEAVDLALGLQLLATSHRSLRVASIPFHALDLVGNLFFRPALSPPRNISIRDGYLFGPRDGLGFLYQP